MVRQVTAKGHFARALAAVSDWCRQHRHGKLRDQHRHLSSMMRGHFAYYGVGGNSRRLQGYVHQTVRIWPKWLPRRDRGKRRPMDEPRRNPETPPSASRQNRPRMRRRERISAHEEPDAENPHVRVCGAMVTSPSTRQRFADSLEGFRDFKELQRSKGNWGRFPGMAQLGASRTRFGIWGPGMPRRAPRYSKKPILRRSSANAERERATVMNRLWRAKGLETRLSIGCLRAGGTAPGAGSGARPRCAPSGGGRSREGEMFLAANP
jgi:hypothetical protein